MHVFPKPTERRDLLSAYETIRAILGFDMFIIALTVLIAELLEDDKKK